MLNQKAFGKKEKRWWLRQLHHPRSEPIRTRKCNHSASPWNGIVTLINGHPANWHRTQTHAAAVTVCHSPMRGCETGVTFFGRSDGVGR